MPGKTDGPVVDPTQLTADEMYTSFLDDLYLTSRIATIGAVSLEGSF